MESDSRRDISCSVQISVKVNTVSVRLCLHTLATARVRLHQLFVIVTVSNVLKRIRCAVHLVFVKLLFLRSSIAGWTGYPFNSPFRDYPD